MALTFGRTGAAEILQRMGRLKTPKVSTRVFNLGGEKIVAKTGETANGVKWTKLYNQDELVSWKRAANGKIEKGRYELNQNPWAENGVFTEINGNKKSTIVRFDGTESPLHRNSYAGDNLSLGGNEYYNPTQTNLYDALEQGLNDIFSF